LNVWYCYRTNGGHRGTPGTLLYQRNNNSKVQQVCKKWHSTNFDNLEIPFNKARLSFSVARKGLIPDKKDFTNCTVSTLLHTR
jgi:hypothetical protein